MNMEHMFEGISAGTPGCEILFVSEQACGAGSVVRMWTECECGKRALRFFCSAHSRGLQEQRVVCYHCKSPNFQVKVS